MPEGIDDKREAVLFIRTRSIPHNAARDQMSIAAQRRHGEHVARELDATITREYVAVGGTGDHVVQDTMKRLIDDLSRNPVAYVITSSFDRLTRDIAEAASLLDAITASGAQLVVNGEPVAAALTTLFTTPPHEGNHHD
jgi:DNA invertase Pin-like site-specific DNA recombinase